MFRKEDTEAFIRGIEAEIAGNRHQNGIIRDAEDQSIFDEEQRRAEEELWSAHTRWTAKTGKRTGWSEMPD